MRLLPLFLALLAVPASSDVTRPATYAEFDTTSVSPPACGSSLCMATAGASLQAAIADPTKPYLYVQPGAYLLSNPVVINRMTSLFIHCADRYSTLFVAQDPSRPLFEVQGAPLVNFAGCQFRANYLAETAGPPQRAAAILTTNTSPIQLEVQDCDVENNLVFAGPGSYRAQNCQLGGGGYVRSAITIDHPNADVFVFGGDISNGPNPRAAGNDDDYYHIWQKHGRLRIYTTTVEGGLGHADFRIETRSALGPHVIGNVRSEGVNGALAGTGAISRLLYVPSTGDLVDVVVKNSVGAWRTEPGDPPANPATAANCVFVSYNGAGTLWLIGDQAHPYCGLHLVEGSAPQGQIFSIGNAQGGSDLFSTLTAGRIVSGVDAFYHGFWTNDWTTLPQTRWVPDGTPPPKLNTYDPPVPLPPQDVLPPSIPRPIVTEALPGMIDVKATYGAKGDGTTDDTAAIQNALDTNCSSAKILFFPAGIYKLTNTLLLNHHLDAVCHGAMPYGGWIAGAGSAVTTLQMAPGLKLGVFATDGLAQATIQGIAFKTWAWQNGDPQIPNFDIEAYCTPSATYPNPPACTAPYFIASQQDGLYDVVFDGGWAGFATGVVPPSLGQCSSMAIFNGSFRNAGIGFDSGHYNAIANFVSDSTFLNNQYPTGSWTTDEPNLPPGGTYSVYRSISRGGSQHDFRAGGGNYFYFYEWDTDSTCYIVTGSHSNHVPYLYERSHLATPIPSRINCPVPWDPSTPQPFPFHVGGAGGPTFLYSRMDHGAVRVGQSGLGQDYFVKLASEIPDWDQSVVNPLYGQLENLPGPPLAIDDFEEGPVALADYRMPTGLGNGSTSSEQAGLSQQHVVGGVRLVTLEAYTANPPSAANATLVPHAGSDDALQVIATGNAAAYLTYDAVAGGAEASNSAGALDLDLSLYDKIVVDVADVQGQVGSLSMRLWDSAGSTIVYGAQPVTSGPNELPLANLTGVDLTDIRQIQFQVVGFNSLSPLTSGASIRVQKISAVRN